MYMGTVTGGQTGVGRGGTWNKVKMGYVEIKRGRGGGI